MNEMITTDLEDGGHGIFQGNILTFAWRDKESQDRQDSNLILPEYI
jgi:hypothetical protein